MKRDQFSGIKGGLSVEELKALTSQRLAQGEVHVKTFGTSSGTNRAVVGGNGVPLSAYNAQPMHLMPTNQSKTSSRINDLSRNSFRDPSIDPMVSSYRSMSPSESSVSSSVSSSSYNLNKGPVNLVRKVPPPLIASFSHHHSRDVVAPSEAHTSGVHGVSLTISELKELTKQRLEREEQMKLLANQNQGPQKERTLETLTKPPAPPTLPGHHSKQRPLKSPPVAHPLQGIARVGDANSVTSGRSNEDSASECSANNVEHLSTYASAPKMTGNLICPPQHEPFVGNTSMDNIRGKDPSDSLSTWSLCSEDSVILDSGAKATHNSHRYAYSSSYRGKQQLEQSFEKVSFSDNTPKFDESCDENYASVPTMEGSECGGQKDSIVSSSDSQSSSILNTTSNNSSASSNSPITASLFNRPKLSVSMPPNIRKQAVEECVGNSSGDGFMKSKEAGRMFRKSLLGFLESDSELDDSCHSLDYSRHSLDRSRRSLDRSRHSAADGSKSNRNSNLDDSRNGNVSKHLKPIYAATMNGGDGQDDELHSSMHSISSRSSGRSSPRKSIQLGSFNSVFSVSSDIAVYRDPLDVSHHVNR